MLRSPSRAPGLLPYRRVPIDADWALQGLISAVALRNFKLLAFDIREAKAPTAAVEVLRNKSVSNSCFIPSLYRLPHYGTACSLQLLSASPELIDSTCSCATSLSQLSFHADGAQPPPRPQSWCEDNPSALWQQLLPENVQCSKSSPGHGALLWCSTGSNTSGSTETAAAFREQITKRLPVLERDRLQLCYSSLTSDCKDPGAAWRLQHSH